MSWLDTSLVIIIMLFIILLVWSKVQHQRMIDTVNEIKEMIRGGKK